MSESTFMLIVFAFMVGLPMACLSLALSDGEEPRGAVDAIMLGFSWFIVAGFVVTAVVGIVLGFSGAF